MKPWVGLVRQKSLGSFCLQSHPRINPILVLPRALGTHSRPVHIVVGRCPTIAKPTSGRSRCDIVARAKVLLPIELKSGRGHASAIDPSLLKVIAIVVSLAICVVSTNNFNFTRPVAIYMSHSPFHGLFINPLPLLAKLC